MGCQRKSGEGDLNKQISLNNNCFRRWFSLPITDIVVGVRGIPAFAENIKRGGIFGARLFVEIGAAVWVNELVRDVGLDFVRYEKWLYAVAAISHYERVKIVGVGIGRVVIADILELLEGVADGGDFGFGFVAVGFLVHSAHGGEGDSREDCDDRDGDEELDEGEGGRI